MGLKLMAGLLLALAPLGAADFWDEKKFTEWSEKEARRVIENSPWARPVSLPDEKAGAINMNVGGLAGTPGEIVKGSQTPSVTAVLRWHSALPVKQAVARLRFGAEAGTSPEAAKTLSRQEDRYVLGFVGFPAGLLKNDPAKVEELKKKIRLKIKNKPEIPASHVQVERRGNLTDLYIFFPKGQDGSPLIEMRDNEVEVEVGFESRTVRRKFKLKDMEFGGKLEI